MIIFALVLTTWSSLNLPFNVFITTAYISICTAPSVFLQGYFHHFPRKPEIDIYKLLLSVTISQS